APKINASIQEASAHFASSRIGQHGDLTSWFFWRGIGADFEFGGLLLDLFDAPTKDLGGFRPTITMMKEHVFQPETGVGAGSIHLCRETERFRSAISLTRTEQRIGREMIAVNVRLEVTHCDAMEAIFFQI